MRHRPPGERGMVTAELAVVAPFGLLLGLVLLWFATVGIAQVRLTDAAREGARVVARGEDPSVARRIVAQQAPGDAVARVRVADGLVRVEVRTTAGMAFLPSFGRRTLTASAVSAVEGGPDSDVAR